VPAAARTSRHSHGLTLNAGRQPKLKKVGNIMKQGICILLDEYVQITSKFKTLGCLILFIPSIAFSQQQSVDDVEIKTHKITDSLHMLEGRGGNIGVSVGEDGVFLIDDQFAPLTGKITKAIKKVSDKPVQFVINTHYHNDHVGGNENLGKKGAIIISHDNSRRYIEAGQLEKMAEESLEEFPVKSLPIITFSDSMTFHYNGETINVFHVDKAHTDGDIVIHFEKANVFHMGDVFVRYGFPYIDLAHGGSINGMINALEQLAVLVNDETVIIPGHGNISSGKDLAAFKDWLINLRDAVKKEMDKGKSKEEIIAQNPIKKHVDSKADVKGIIGVIFDSLGNP
jgi:glyoxylase-like metal-dependent hydrolase (beta-lactamase superfamily II)